MLSKHPVLSHVHVLSMFFCPELHVKNRQITSETAQKNCKNCIVIRLKSCELQYFILVPHLLCLDCKLTWKKSLFQMWLIDKTWTAHTHTPQMETRATDSALGCRYQNTQFSFTSHTLVNLWINLCCLVWGRNQGFRFVAVHAYRFHYQPHRKHITLEAINLYN